MFREINDYLPKVTPIINEDPRYLIDFSTMLLKHDSGRLRYRVQEQQLSMLLEISS